MARQWMQLAGSCLGALALLCWVVMFLSGTDVSHDGSSRPCRRRRSAHSRSRRPHRGSHGNPPVPHATKHADLLNSEEPRTTNRLSACAPHGWYRASRCGRQSISKTERTAACGAAWYSALTKRGRLTRCDGGDRERIVRMDPQ